MKKIKFLTQLYFGLSHLREHQFKHSFRGPFNPVCNYCFDIKHLHGISSVNVASTQIRVTFFRALLKMLNVNCWIILSCLYDKQYEEKTEHDKFCPVFISRFFLLERNSKTWWDHCIAFYSIVLFYKNEKGHGAKTSCYRPDQ